MRDTMDHLPFPPIRREDFPGIEQPLGIKGVLDPSQYLQSRRSHLPFEVRRFDGTDAVFAGDGAAQFDGGGKNLLERLLHASDFLRVAGIGRAGGMEVAVARVAEGADEQVVFFRDLRDAFHHRCDLRARDGGVFEDRRRAQAGQGRQRRAAGGAQRFALLLGGGHPDLPRAGILADDGNALEIALHHFLWPVLFDEQEGGDIGGKADAHVVFDHLDRGLVHKLQRAQDDAVGDDAGHRASGAVLLGAVGGPKWDALPADKRPEAALLGLRKALGLYANLRPVTPFNALLPASPLKSTYQAGANVLIVRELTGGLYFGEKRRMRTPEGQEEAVDTLVYRTSEIERVVRRAFELARGRRKRVTSVDKANVLESSRLWREAATRVAAEFPDVELEHILVDVFAMELILNPRRFDVVVTENLFGDILSDEAAVLTGSIGMLPSASLADDRFGLYEPVHGSAPDIAGEDRANPLAAILSVALMLRHTFGDEAAAAAVEDAVKRVLESGVRTIDLAEPGDPVVGTKAMGDRVVAALEAALVK